MANKFTKSVLERQAKEMHATPTPEPIQPALSTAEPPAPVVETPAPIREPEPLPEPKMPMIAEKPAVKKSRATPDLSDYIIRNEGRTAKNKTFYLDRAVIDAVHRAASAQKITDSKLVNDILRKILDI